jgi:hypothetical protein
MTVSPPARHYIRQRRAADERRRHVPTGQHLDATFSCDGPLEMGLHPDLTVQEIDPGGPADRAGAP